MRAGAEFLPQSYGTKETEHSLCADAITNLKLTTAQQCLRCILESDR